jgi:glycosyltransferase involved in cell wall biosynthesis
VALDGDFISICICTYKRPILLARLLDSLSRQAVSSEFYFEIVVIDNDKNRSAEDVVRCFQPRTEKTIIYENEPTQNISLARNKALSVGIGNLIAFIDDDEYPCEQWLLLLHKTLKSYTVNGVLGPVLPEFPDAAPAWLKKANLFDRRRLMTGSKITHRDARTGNVLFQKSIFEEGDLWFDPAFGRTGGEDSDFFRRQFNRGRSFVWCDEAITYETVPPERWKIGYFINQYLRSGTINGEMMRAGKFGSNIGNLSKYLSMLCAYLAIFPFSILVPKHIRVRVLLKLAYCVGVFTAFYGLSIIRNREYT